MKRQAAGGQDQFEGSVLKTGAGGAAAPGGRGTPVTIDELEGCFDSLTTAETKGKKTLDELVKTNSTLTSSIVELSATKTQLTKEVASLSQEVNKYKKGGREINGRRLKLENYFPNCKREIWNDPDDCFELKNNAHKRHSRWN